MTRLFAVVWNLAVAAPLALWTATASGEAITVSAAASLTDAFKELAARFEAANPGTTVQLNFGSSGSLLHQIANGAPVDVFATADEHTMDIAHQRGHVVDGSRRRFARNTLVLIQPFAAKPALESVSALRAPAVQRVAIGNPASVPVGRYAKQALEGASHWDALQSKLVPAQNVRQVLNYVARGEVDAGVVYATDAALLKDRVKVALTLPVDPPVSYAIAVLQHGRGKGAAQRFVDTVLSVEGQAVLAGHGFEPGANGG